MHPSLHRTTRDLAETVTSCTDEVCPLCLARYAAVDECICGVCEAPSCPDCATTMPGMPGTQRMLCYACPVPTTH